MLNKGRCTKNGDGELRFGGRLKGRIPFAWRSRASFSRFHGGRREYLSLCRRLCKECCSEVGCGEEGVRGRAHRACKRARRNENAWQSWKMATLPHWEDRRRGIEVVRAGLRRKEWWIVRQKMLLGQLPLCCGLGLYQLSSAGRHWGFLSWDVTRSDLCLRWFIGSPTHWDQVERRARNSGTVKNLAVDGYSVMEIQARESLEMKQTWF